MMSLYEMPLLFFLYETGVLYFRLEIPKLFGELYFDI